MELPKIWEVYPDLARAVKKAHDEAGLRNGGHDMDHALRVGQTALQLAWDLDQGQALLAGVAGLCHNADRILERLQGLKSQNVSKVSDGDVVALADSWLVNHTSLDEKSRGSVIQAVVHHGSKPNTADDSLVMIALADADRLINMEPDVIIRSAQHHYDIPALDPVFIEATPGANYRDPKTVLWDIANCMSWAAKTGPYILRLPLARKLGEERAEFLKMFIATLKRQRAELGLMPYPEI